MGLAPYGEPRYVDRILDELIDLKDDGSFKLNMKYFNYCVGLRMTNRKFAQLFGGPERTPETGLTQREMDLAASVQAVTEMAMLNMARFARKETGCNHLVLAGGVALNCVANGKVLREGIFDDLWIQPAAGDAGGALGSALFVHHQLLDGPRKVDNRRDLQSATLLGPEFSSREIGQFIAANDIVATRHDNPDDLLDRVAEILGNQNVVGWFQGRMEYGPRALGGRSILGDPRSREMQTKMNLKIKFRESFRPFAPSIMIDHVEEFFDLDRGSPYMLLVADVAERKRTPVASNGFEGLDKLKAIRSEVPAITHVDCSARVQTVSQEDNPLYYGLLKRFYEKTGCPVVVNTSFNVRGEPIVCTPDDAFRCFARTNMDFLVLGPYVIDKKEQSLPPLDDSWQQEFELD
jgi:carbamoyltransferase